MSDILGPDIPSEPPTGSPRPTAPQPSAMADFPWWIVIILGFFTVAFLAIMLNPTQRVIYTAAFRFIVPGVAITIFVTVCAYAIAIVIGLIVGLMRLSKNPWLNQPARVYVEIMRGLPLLVIVLYAGFVIGPWVRDTTNGLWDPPMLTPRHYWIGNGLRRIRLGSLPQRHSVNRPRPA